MMNRFTLVLLLIFAEAILSCSQNITIDCNGTNANSPACLNASKATSSRNLPGSVNDIVTTVGIGQVIISWQPASDATSYKIKRGTKSKNYSETYDNVVSPFVVTGLASGSYYFVIIAVNSNGSLDGSEFTATVKNSESNTTSTVNGTSQTDPVLTASPTSQSVQQLFAINPVVITKAVEDTSITYSCVYTTNDLTTIDTTGLSCLSLPSFHVAFDRATGVLDWTPSEAATSASTDTIYSFKITAINSQNLSGAVTFTITVQPGMNLSIVSNRSFANSTPLVQGSSYSVSLINLVSGDNAGLNYTCSFTTANQASTDCTSLPDSAIFGVSTGQLDWTPSTNAHGTFTITITGTKGSLVGTRTFNLQVQKAFITNQLLLSYDAQFADSISIGTNNPIVSNWKNLTTSDADATLNGFAFTNIDGWSGDGSKIISSGGTGPYRLSFNGSSTSMLASNAMNAVSNLSFDTWIRPNAGATAGAVIFSNGESLSPGTVGEVNKGLSLKQVSSRYTSAGQVQLSLGSNSYVDEVFANNPDAYFRLDETRGNIFYDTATDNVNPANILSGTISFQQTGAIPGDSNTAINLSGSAVQIPVSNYHISNSTDFTISLWVKNTTQTSGGDSLRPIIAIHDSSNLLNNGIHISSAPSDSGSPGDVYVRIGNQQTSSPVSLNDGNWHQLTLVRNGSTGLLYNNGNLATNFAIGTLDVASSLVYIGGSFLDNGGGTRYFKGLIDDFAIYSHALSAGQVLSQFNAAQKRLSCTSINRLTDNTWHHVAGSFDNSGPTLKLYVDGIPQCSQTLSGASYTGSSSQLSFGADPTALFQYWTGGLAQFRAYSTVLSGGQIETNRLATMSDFAVGDIMPVTANLKFWLVADDIGGTADGNNIARWVDRSGNNFHEYQDNPTYRPALKLAANGINNHAVVRFNGVNSVMTTSFTGAITAKTMIVVTRLTTLTPSGTAGGGGILSLENPSQFDAIVYNETAAKRWLQGSEFLVRLFNSPIDETSLAGLLITYTSAASNYRIYRNGALLSSSTAFSPPSFSNSNFTIGMRHYINLNIIPGSGNHNYNGDLAEALIFTSVLSTNERQAVEAYLQAKYGL